MAQYRKSRSGSPTDLVPHAWLHFPGDAAVNHPLQRPAELAEALGFVDFKVRVPLDATEKQLDGIVTRALVKVRQAITENRKRKLKGKAVAMMGPQTVLKISDKGRRCEVVEKAGWKKHDALADALGVSPVRLSRLLGPKTPARKQRTRRRR